MGSGADVCPECQEDIFTKSGCLYPTCPYEWGPDDINSPSHYNSGGVECIEAIESALTKEEFKGYLRGNVIKYVWRCWYKGGKKDLDKASWYLDRLKERSDVPGGG